MSKAMPALKLSVTLPDGTKATRITRHDYTVVCAYRITEIKDVENTTKAGRVGNWHAQWSRTLKGAQSMARKWQTSPIVKQGYATAETKLIQVWGDKEII